MDLISYFSSPPNLASSLRTGLIIVHLMGLVFGLGAATMLDLIIVRLIVAGKVTQEYWKVVHLLSKVVTFGLALLWISGVGFLLHYGQFDITKLANEKVWAKVIIVAILTLNGVFIHKQVLPLMKERIGRNMFDGMTSVQTSILIATGIVSGVSWYVPFLLGAMPQLNFVVPALTILTIYATMLTACLVVALQLKRIVLPILQRSTAPAASERSVLATTAAFEGLRRPLGGRRTAVKGSAGHRTGRAHLLRRPMTAAAMSGAMAACATLLVAHLAYGPIGVDPSAPAQQAIIQGPNFVQDTDQALASGDLSLADTMAEPDVAGTRSLPSIIRESETSKIALPLPSAENGAKPKATNVAAVPVSAPDAVAKKPARQTMAQVTMRRPEPIEFRLADGRR